MHHLGTGLVRLLCALIILFLMAPVVIVVVLSLSSATYMSFPPPGLSLQWYERFFASDAWLEAAWNSLWVGLGAMIIATLLGTPAAVGLVRGRFPGKMAINALILSPVVVPGIIVAIGLYYGYARIGLVGHPLGLVLAHACLAVPFVVINVASALTAVDSRIEQAARNLGAGPVGAFMQVTLPLIQPGIFAGALFAFATSFDELLAALFLSGSETQTLPRRMWDQLRFEIEPTLAAASTLLIAVTVCLMVGAEIWRRRAERIRTRPLDA